MGAALFFAEWRRRKKIKIAKSARSRKKKIPSPLQKKEEGGGLGVPRPKSTVRGLFGEKKSFSFSGEISELSSASFSLAENT